MKKLLMLILLSVPAIADEVKVGECTAIGPEQVIQGAIDWCSTGAFSEVRATIDEDSGLFHARYQFNDFGYELFTKKQEIFFNAFEELLGKFGKAGITASFAFYYGEAFIFECSGIECRDIS